MVIITSNVHVSASSWNPSLLVNTESFQIIDDQDDASDIYLQFGDTVAETLTYERSAQNFNFSDDLHVEGNISASGSIIVEQVNEVPAIRIDSNAVASPGLQIDIVGNSNSPHILFGENGTFDTNLFRSAANTLQTDDSFSVAGNVSGATLTVSYLVNCTKIKTNANGDLECSTTAVGTGAAFALYNDTAGGLNVNAGLVAIPWNNEVREDSGFAHDVVLLNSRITLNDNAWYRVNYSINYDTITNNRKNVHCQARLNGTTVLDYSHSYSYTRTTTDRYGTNTANFLVETTSDNEYIEILCNGEGTVGVTSTVANQSWITLELLGVSGGSIAPYCSEVANSFIEPTSTGTLIINGGNFDYETEVSIAGWEGTIDDVRYISNEQIEVDITAGATETTYSVVLTNGPKSSTDFETDSCANAVTVETSTWVDLRSGGTTLTSLTTRTNYALGTQTEANAGVTRDASGMYNSGGFAPWSHWIRFDDYGWTRGIGTTFQFITRNSGSFFMAGIGSNATNPTSGAQYYEAEVEAYFQNGTTMWGFYGNNGTPAGAWSQSATTAVTNDSCVKIKYLNDGSSGNNIIVYQLPTCNQTDWDNEATVLNTIVSSNPADEVNLFPFAILPNNTNVHLVGFKVQ